MVRSASEFIIGPRFARTRWRVSNHEATGEAPPDSYLARYFRNISVSRSGLVCGGMKPRYAPSRPIK